MRVVLVFLLNLLVCLTLLQVWQVFQWVRTGNRPMTIQVRVRSLSFSLPRPASFRFLTLLQGLCMVMQACLISNWPDKNDRARQVVSYMHTCNLEPTTEMKAYQGVLAGKLTMEEATPIALQAQQTYLKQRAETERPPAFVPPRRTQSPQ
jgi:hypothetical protein